MGIADTVESVEARLSFGIVDASGETPAGVPIEDGTKKSSRSISAFSFCFACSDDLRSWAIPLGAFWACERASSLIPR